MNRSLLLWFQLIWKVTIYQLWGTEIKEGTLGGGQLPWTGNNKNSHPWMTPRKGKSSNTVKLDRSKETIQKPYLTDQFFFQNCGLMRSNDSYYEHFWLFAGHPTKTAFRNGLKNVQNQTLPCSFMHFTCGLRDPLKHLPWERWWKHGSLPRFSSPQEILPTKQRKNSRWSFSNDILPKCLHGTLHLT